MNLIYSNLYGLINFACLLFVVIKKLEKIAGEAARNIKKISFTFLNRARQHPFCAPFVGQYVRRLTKTIQSLI